jgi:site-specific DNA-methyltransferase (adenine-specific)
MSDNQPSPNRERAARNQTLTISSEEKNKYTARLLHIASPIPLPDVLNRTVNQNIFDVIEHLPNQFADLVFADPPYNLSKSFNGRSFSAMPPEDYEAWLDSWISRLIRVLKPTASIYICGDWRSSSSIYRVARNYFIVRNRITWEREKGRGAHTNWKNCSEDMWFCTMSDQYTFNVDAVKLKRRVVAPYTTEDGTPKDWDDTDEGRFRLTYPSNLWTDLTVPFWSMPENTDHPTQKPEKLLAKVILASTNQGDTVFDPFLGSGTTSVVAKKLGRGFVGVEIDQTYCCYAEKRLQMADQDKSIQGYSEGYFWERNTLT